MRRFALFSGTVGEEEFFESVYGSKADAVRAAERLEDNGTFCRIVDIADAVYATADAE